MAWVCVLLDKIKTSKVIYLVCFILVDNILANNRLVEAAGALRHSAPVLGIALKRLNLPRIPF